MRSATKLKEFSYSKMDDKDIFSLIKVTREGVKYHSFMKIANSIPFTLYEWSHFLHISDRTMLRYKKEKKSFDTLQSEKIIQIVMLYKLGTEVFGNSEKFDTWLSTENLALGKVKPKDLLDSTFGITLLKDELTRIEHGVLA